MHSSCSFDEKHFDGEPFDCASRSEPELRRNIFTQNSNVR